MQKENVHEEYSYDAWTFKTEEGVLKRWTRSK